MTTRVLNCVIAYNRFHYLKNSINSLNQYFKIGDLLVVDDGSEEPELQKYLEELETGNTFVIRQKHEEHTQWLYGGLYSAMNKGIEFALEREYDFINFVQDDTQFVWYDPHFMEKVLGTFEQYPDAIQVSYHFFKKIMITWVTRRIEYYAEANCYHFKPYTISDLGIVPLSLIKKHGFRINGSENERNGVLHPQGFKRYSLHSPILAWIPWPTTFRKRASFGQVLPPPRKYYLKPLSSDQINKLTLRPLNVMPCHEDYCLPWGWRCLYPYWFTKPNWKEYITLLWFSARDKSFLFPHYVMAKK